MAEQAERAERQRSLVKIERRNRQFSRVRIVDEADGQTLHIGATPLRAFFYSTKTTSIYLPYVAFVAPVAIIAFVMIWEGVLSIPLGLAGTLGFHLLFLAAFLIYKWVYWSSVAITVADGKYAIRERGRPRITAVGRVEELRFRVYRDTDWDLGFCTLEFYADSDSGSILYLSHDDLDRIVGFLKSWRFGECR